MLSYMVGTLGMARSSSLAVVMFSSALGVVATMIMGAISDRIGYAKVYIFGAVFTFFYAFPMFILMDTRITAIALLAMCVGYGFGFSGFAGSQAAFLANLFETRYRFSGIAMCRELNGMIVAGPTPFIASALVALAGGSPRLVVIFLMVCCALSLVAILAVKRRAIHGSAIQEEGIADQSGRPGVPAAPALRTIDTGRRATRR